MHSTRGDRGTIYVDDSEGDAEICQVAENNRDANAKLIAAAPDLLRELQNLMRFVDNLEMTLAPDSILRHNVALALDKAKPAIKSQYHHDGYSEDAPSNSGEPNGGRAG